MKGEVKDESKEERSEMKEILEVLIATTEKEVI